MDRAKQIEKYRGLQCAVCGKWGAVEPFGEPARALVLFAAGHGLTLRRPESSATHPKCLSKLKTLVSWKRNLAHGRT